jgi:WXXGXW repeat (2 copies)
LGNEESEMQINFSNRSLTRLVSLALIMLAMSAGALAQFRVSVTIAPPALPVYEQPLCPGEGYIWTPGYWYWDDDVDDYYWVPGTWVMAPEVGFLWTPGWWGWGGDAFIFHEGYWGPEVGFYGGINYGFGYFGVGFAGGRWDNGQFFYNRAVTNVNVTNIQNVYNTKVVNNTTITRVSYNGGDGGIEARPTPQEEAAAQQRHIPPVAAQTQHVQSARSNQQLRASVNQGKPPIAATEKPGEFSGHSVIAAKEAGAPYHPPANRGATGPRGNEQPSRPEEDNSHPAVAVHPKDLPPVEHPPGPTTGDAKLDQKYEKQQKKLSAQQEKERQQLQEKQDQEHQQLAQQKAGAAKTQQLEAKHQQQTQQLQQKHAAQQQQLQQRQQAARPSGPPPHKG